MAVFTGVLFGRLASTVCYKNVQIINTKILFQEQYGDAARLKGIFYRSIQQCPGVKVRIQFSKVNIASDLHNLSFFRVLDRV